MNDGRAFQSGEVTFRGEQDHPLTEEQLLGKYRWLTGALLPESQVSTIVELVQELPESPTIMPLINNLARVG